MDRKLKEDLKTSNSASPTSNSKMDAQQVKMLKKERERMEKQQKKMEKLEQKRQKEEEKRQKTIEKKAKKPGQSPRAGKSASAVSGAGRRESHTSDDSDSSVSGAENSLYFGISTVKGPRQSSSMASSAETVKNYVYTLPLDLMKAKASPISTAYFQPVKAYEAVRRSNVTPRRNKGWEGSEDGDGEGDAELEGEDEEEDLVQHFSGPGKGEEESVIFMDPHVVDREVLRIQCISTYPFFPGYPPIRLGDPICDHYSVDMYRNAAVFSLCDGCGWGLGVRDAARLASTSVCERIGSLLPKCHTLRDIASLLMDCVPFAHNRIVRSKDDPHVAGTTTILCGAVVKLVGRKSQASGSRLHEGSNISLNSNNNNNNNYNSGNSAQAQNQVNQNAAGNVANATVNTAAALSSSSDSDGLVNVVPASHSKVTVDSAAASAANWEPPSSQPAGHVPAQGGSGIVQSHGVVVGGNNGSGIVRHASSRAVDSSAGSSASMRPRRRKYAAVYMSIGDCKAYRFHLSRRGVCEVVDLTLSNRMDSLDATDCGGRIGPYLGTDRLDPDLRNLIVGVVECAENDLIAVCTDGVHDNLDPQSLGLLPSELGGPMGSSWTDMPRDEALKLKNAFSLAKLRDLYDTIVSATTPPGEERVGPTPSQLTDALIDLARTVTQPTREFLENNPGQRQPADVRAYPGKLDHTTCVCFRVGEN